MNQQFTKKQNKTNAILVFLVVFLSTRASGIANSNIMIFGVLIYNFWIAYLRKIKPDKSIFIFFSLFGLVVFQNFFRLQEYFDPMRYLKLISLMVIAYLTIKIVRFDFFRHFCRIMYWLILLSIPFYIYQLIAPASLLSLGRTLNSIFPGLMDIATNKENTSLNMLVYTIEFVENFRNSGIMWEPGGFATTIALALYFEMLSNGFKFTRRIWIYIAGVITSFSTTGIIVTTILLLYILFQKASSARSRYLKPVLYFMVTLFTTGTVLAFFQSPILFQKISEEIEVQQYIIENMDSFDEGVQSLGRFGSLEVDLRSIQDKPIFGRGYTDENFREEYENFNFTNGLSTFIGRMGLVGLIWLIISLHRSGNAITLAINGQKKGNILPILVLVISFSNPVLFTPLYLVLQFFFLPFKVKRHEPETVYRYSCA